MEDAEIIQLYFQRNEKAIAETAAKYGKYCSSIAGNILDSQQDVEECVNDTYLNTWNAIPPQRPALFKAFLGKITRNLSFNRYKHSRADKRGGGQISLVLDELTECLPGGTEPETVLERKELVRTIEQFLSDLPKDRRVMFVCRYWYADSISDIALKYGISENSVSVTLNRLRKRLQRYLLEGGAGHEQ